MEYILPLPGQVTFVEFKQSYFSFWDTHTHRGVVRPNDGEIKCGQVIRRVVIPDTPIELKLVDTTFHSRDGAQFELALFLTVQPNIFADPEAVLKCLPAFDSNDNNWPTNWLQLRLMPVLRSLRQQSFADLAGLCGENPVLVSEMSSGPAHPGGLTLAAIEAQATAILAKANFQLTERSLFLELKYPPRFQKELDELDAPIIEHKNRYRELSQDLKKREAEIKNRLLELERTMREKANEITLKLEEEDKKFAEKKQKTVRDRKRLDALEAKGDDLAKEEAEAEIAQMRSDREANVRKHDREAKLKETTDLAEFSAKLSAEQAKLEEAQAEETRRRENLRLEDAKHTIDVQRQEVEALRTFMAQAGMPVTDDGSKPLTLEQLREEHARHRKRIAWQDSLEVRKREQEFEYDKLHSLRKLDWEGEDRAKTYALALQAVQERLQLLRDDTDFERRLKMVTVIGKEVTNTATSAKGIVEHLRVAASVGNGRALDEILAFLERLMDSLGTGGRSHSRSRNDPESAQPIPPETAQPGRAKDGHAPDSAPPAPPDGAQGTDDYPAAGG